MPNNKKKPIRPLREDYSINSNGVRDSSFERNNPPDHFIPDSKNGESNGKKKEKK